MRLLPLIFLAAGCGGAPFAAELAPPPEEAGAPDAADLEGGPPEGGDGGSEADALADGQGGQVDDGGERDAAAEAHGVPEAGPDVACVLSTHTDGIAQTWQDCAPVGTYDQVEAEAACAANGGAQCVANDCGGSGSLAICDVDPYATGFCICWVYSGPLVGNVNVAGGCTNALQASCNSGPPYTWK